MKYLLLLGDGMSDYPIKELSNKTPLEYANTPLFDKLAQKGRVGLVSTVPDKMPPGSDVANLSLFGYDPKKYYTGRSPIEAANMGIVLGPKDLAIRCNFVTLSEDKVYENKTMIDYSAGEFPNQHTPELIDYLNQHLKGDNYQFYPGTSYRNCLVLKNAKEGTVYTPPHDISAKKIKGHLPNQVNGDFLLDLMKKSNVLLDKHPINLKRKKENKNPANSIWLWGEGRKMNIPSFYSLYKKRGAVISAVDLLKGLAIYAGMDVVNVKGATGTIETNYENKAQAVIETFEKGADFVFLHIEASDECSHQKDLKAKLKAIEFLDNRALPPIYDYLIKSKEDFSILISPDHPTPLCLGTHTSDYVPFLLYRSNEEINSGLVYNEKTAKQSGLFFKNGPALIKEFLK